MLGNGERVEDDCVGDDGSFAGHRDSGALAVESSGCVRLSVPGDATEVVPVERRGARP
jgi:hypothetical protein